MVEYIDRDKALEEFDAWVESTGVLPRGTSYYAEARGCIECVPAADVEPVVHAHWIPKPQIVRSPYARNYSCSHCGHEPLEAIGRCPHCGAHMDREVTEGD